MNLDLGPEGEDPSFTEQLKGAAGGASAILGTLLLLPVLILSPALSLLPKGWRIWHKAHAWTAYKMQKAASADALANVRGENGKEDVLPAAWVEGGEDDKDLTGWKVKGKGDKRYDPAVHGRSASRFGKASLIHINEDSTEQGTWAEAAIDNALQLDRENYLFRSAQVVADQVNVDANGQAQANLATDGGQPVFGATVTQPGVLEDALVPISSRTGYDGQMVSWNQYQSLKSEQSDQETIRDAKNSSWVAAKLDEQDGKDLLKWALILGATHAVALFKDELGAAIVGLAGGSGGGAVSGVTSGLGMMANAGLLGVF